ncbi:MAG TPA: hypothetical protein VF733_07135 [Candidatus Saccharimonadales bacterium]
MTHQELVNELVAQIESRKENNEEVVIDFVLDETGDPDDIVEVILTDVKFEDGIIKCELSQ